MPELRLEKLRMRTGGDHQRRVGVPEVVEAEWRELGAPGGRPEDACHEVVLAPDRAAARREDEPEFVGHAGEQLSPQDPNRLGREVDLAFAGARLRRDDLESP
jgi:hypothetical protein